MKSIFVLFIVSGLIFAFFPKESKCKSIQPEELFFRTISPIGEITDKGIEKIVKDHLGFIWIGTRGGLYRFDGYEFKKYRHSDKDQSSLTNDNIRDIIIDQQNRIWIATANGLNLYNRANDSFEQIQLDNIKSFGTIYDLEIDKNGTLYIAYNQGIVKYKVNEDYYKLIKLPYSNIRNLQIDNHNNILVSFLKNGVYLINYEDDVKQIIPESNSNIRAFHLANKRLYIGYEDEGVKVYESNGNFVTSLTEKNGKVSHNKINCIFNDSQNNIWIGTYGGLDLLDSQGNSYSYKHNIIDPYSLPNNSVYEVYEDKNSNFWIGTWSGGVAFYSRFDNKFESVKREPGMNSITNNYVTCFTKDKDGILWIGTERGGLNSYNATNGKFSHHQIDIENNNPMNIKSITTLKNNNIFIGTYKRGFYYLDKQRKPHRIFLQNITPDNEKIYAIEESDSGLWIGDFNHGLFHLSGKDYLKQVHYKRTKNSNELTSSKITSLFLNNGNLWIGTNNGLNLQKKGSKKIIHFLNDKDNPASLSSNEITTITCDLNGDIWVGTRNGGINKYIAKDSAFISYSQQDGLAGNDANGIICDELGYLWVGTENGISKINPTDGSIKNYNKLDGLQGNQFNQGAAYKSKDGKLFFGGTNGYSIINPKRIKDNPIPPKPTINKIIANNEVVSVTDENSPLITSISETSLVKLKHNQSSITLKFLCDNYLNPQKNKFAYRLRGVNEIWQYSFSNSVNYSNLAPGKYIFELQAANNDNLWSSKAAQFEIIIMPPWWSHPLAIIFYLVFGLILVFIIEYFIIHQACLNYTIKLETLKRENEDQIHKLKMQFFTNISHEFKTPLTLILTPIQRILNNKQIDQDLKDDLNLANKNAVRLKRLINQFIEFRKIEQIQLNLNVSKVDITIISKNVYDCFTELAKSRNIDYTFIPEIESTHVWIDVEKIENTIYNLLSNAFKYTEDEGQIHLKLRTTPMPVPESWMNHNIGEKLNTKGIYIEILDSGLGIRNEEIKKIFKRFYRSDVANIQEGSGIGLSLAKEYILLHKGNISVYSKPNEGSIFTLGVMLGITHLKELDYIKFNETKTTQQKLDIFTDTQASKTQKTNQHSHTNKTCILLVEDNRELNQYLTKVLSDKYKVVSALNGSEGQALASRLLPELIISDIMLPGTNGFKLCENLKTEPLTSHIPIILLTALSEDQQRIKGVEIGADAYLTKPIDILLLMSTIKNLIEARKKLRIAFGGVDAISDREDGLSAYDASLIKRAKAYITANINNPDISISMLAEELNMSRSNLHRKIKSLTGKTITEYIRSIRINKAMELMEKEDISIIEVCYAVGFNSTSYFSKCFKEIYGVNPSKYKHNIGNT